MVYNFGFLGPITIWLFSNLPQERSTGSKTKVEYMKLSTEDGQSELSASSNGELRLD